MQQEFESVQYDFVKRAVCMEELSSGVARERGDEEECKIMRRKGREKMTMTKTGDQNFRRKKR